MRRTLFLVLLVVLRFVMNLVEFGSILPPVTGKTEIKEVSVNQSITLMRVRDLLRDRVKSAMPKDEAGVVLGIVLGIKSDLPSWMYNKLVKSGTIHIMVASGYNVMVVGSFVMALMVFVINRRVAIWLAIVVMAVYSVLAGWQPPVVRALIMGSVLMIGGVYGRRGKSLDALLLTMVIMFLFDPSVLESISFWLSVSACVGIFWLHPLIESRLSDKSYLFSKTELLSTLSAQITTMPIILGAFGRMSLIALLSNTLILPLVPILMLMGVLTIVVPDVFGWSTGLLARLIIELVALFGV